MPSKFENTDTSANRETCIVLKQEQVNQENRKPSPFS